MGIAYLRTYWSVFGISLFGNIQVSEIGVGAVNASYNIFFAILALCVGYGTAKWLLNRSTVLKHSGKKYIILVWLVGTGGILIWHSFNPEFWLRGPNTEIIVFIAVTLCGLSVPVFTHIKEKRLQLSPTKKLLAFIAAGTFMSTVDAWEDATQIEKNLEYEWVYGKELELGETDTIKILGKMNGTYFFIDQNYVKHEIALERLTNIKSYDREKESKTSKE